MEKFVISLNSAIDRRNHINHEFRKYDISFEFFEAVEPDHLEKLCSLYNINLNSSLLTDNEKACFMSHFCLWQKAVDEKLEYIAIFEDDIYLSSNAGVFLNSDDWINKDIIKIEKIAKNVLLELKGRTQQKYKEENYMLGQLKSSHMGAGGYILSLNAAKDLIKYIKNSEKLDHVDQIIFKWYRKSGVFNVYQMNPVLCIQDCILYPESQKFTSSLQWRNEKKIKLNLWRKAVRELKRLIIKVVELPYKVKLTFIK